VEPHLFIILVIGLSMDAFVVSIGKGLALRRATVRDAMVIALWFGIGHAVMTAIGYTLSESVHQYISEFDHWIIFGVLAYIAFNLIRDAFSKEEQDVGKETNAVSMFPLTVAVSLDAMAAGFAFASDGIGIVLGFAGLGLTAGLMSFGGVYLGNRIGRIYGRIATLAGAAILLIVGTIALLEGLGLF